MNVEPWMNNLVLLNSPVLKAMKINEFKFPIIHNPTIANFCIFFTQVGGKNSHVI